jgi:UPF0716 protein FxsA
MWLLIALVALPLVEIGLFVELGGALGLWPTLLWTVASVVIGLAVARSTGARTAAAVNRALTDLRNPARPVADGALRLAAGVLLILPGFFTDALGLVLLVPPVRAILLRRIGRGRPPPRGPVIVDALYRDVTPRDPPSAP